MCMKIRQGPGRKFSWSWPFSFAASLNFGRCSKFIFSFSLHFYFLINAAKEWRYTVFKSSRGSCCFGEKWGLQRRLRAESPKFLCCIGAFWGMQRLWNFRFAALAIILRCSEVFPYDYNSIIWNCSLMEKIRSSEIPIFSNVVIIFGRFTCCHSPEIQIKAGKPLKKGWILSN